jgi:hypothetical protein
VRLALLLLLLAALVLAGCESNFDRNARAALEGHKLLGANRKITIARANRDVKVRRAVLVSSGGAYAAAVELRNRGRRAQAGVPLLIDVRSPAGRSVYRNDLSGLQPALQRVALVPPGRPVWWVNDQLLGVTAARSVRARVGKARAIRRVPPVSLRGVHFTSDSNGTYLTGRVVNRGPVQRDLPIFGVALRGSKVVAAGRALVLKATSAKPARFRLIFVGNPRGARISLTVAPAAI